MKALTLAATAAAALVSLPLSGNVAALDAHVYSGSYCDAYYGSQTSSFAKYSSGIRNNSTVSRYVNCPVLQDSVANTAGINRQYVNYVGAGTFRCTMYSKNANGSTRQVRTASRVGSGWLTIPDITSDYTYGAYDLVCLVPRQGRIATIFVEERT